MKAFAICVMAVSLASATACGGTDAHEVPATGSDVTVQKRDGVVVAGRVVEVKPERVVLELRDGKRTEVPRGEIASMTASGAGSDRAASSADVPNRSGSDGSGSGEGATPERDRGRAESAPSYRDVTIPAGTVLPVELTSSVASDSSNVEDPVRASLRRSVRVGGVEALPAGTALLGHVTSAERAGRVKGRARVVVRFTELDVPGDGGRHSIQTQAIARQAVATKKQDAAKIGAGAAGGAIVGGILGGGDGAAKGAAVGGAAGTGVVLSTRGKEVRLGPGAALAVRLTAPLTVRLPVR
jgi:hypothetical protein